MCDRQNVSFTSAREHWHLDELGIALKSRRIQTMSFLPALKEKEASKLLATLDPLHYRVLSWSLEAIETILTGSYDESSLNLFVVNLCIRAVFPTQYFPTMITFFSALEPIYNDEHRMTTSMISSSSCLGKCKQTLVTNWVVTQFFRGVGERLRRYWGERSSNGGRMNVSESIWNVYKSSSYRQQNWPG